jgi:arylsulfatase
MPATRPSGDQRETYRGGVSDPFLVDWLKGLKAKGEIRTQYAHAIDMLPTVLASIRHQSA